MFSDIKFDGFLNYFLRIKISLYDLYVCYFLIENVLIDMWILFW